MQIELTITEIAARLRVSERTALRRIAVGKLSAVRLGQNRYAVLVEDIEALAPQEKLAGLEHRVSQLEQETAALKTRVEAIEQDRNLRMPAPAVPELATHPPPPQPTRRTQSKPTTSDKPDLPPGWASWNAFIVRHGLRIDDQPVKVLDKRDFVQTGEYRQGKATITNALDYGGQDMLARNLMKYHKWHECNVDGCPCHALAPQQPLW